MSSKTNDPTERSTEEIPLPAPSSVGRTVEADWLKGLCLDAGADAVGLVEIDRPAIADQRDELRAAFPETRTIVVCAYRVNRENLRTVFHSVANLEFRHAWEGANRTARAIAKGLRSHGLRALNVPAGFPFEADRWPAKMWLTCDKILAEQAGLGKMGWNRLVLHPVLGSAVVFGTILVDAESTAYDRPIEADPCIKCKLCVSVCPVGAISADGSFSFTSCYTHNYRERLGGFSNWVETVVASRSVREYRRRVSDAETVSMWQNLSMGAQTRCDRCMGICPAGEEVSGDYLRDRKAYTEGFLKRFLQLNEPVYVVPGSDAEAHATRKFPHKTVKRVSNGIRPNSARMFLGAMPIVFQRDQSEGLSATYHFTFTGEEDCRATVVIRDKRLAVTDGLVGNPDLRITADARTWIGFLAKERNLLWAVVSGKIKVKGPLRLMKAFAKCFPS